MMETQYASALALVKTIREAPLPPGIEPVTAFAALPRATRADVPPPSPKPARRAAWRRSERPRRPLLRAAARDRQAAARSHRLPRPARRAGVVALDKKGRELNAVATLMRERALEEAEAAEKELRAGRDRGPLHGIPYAAKDLFDTDGTTTTFGARPFEGRVPERDATVIVKLREAGAVLCAKLTMAELAGGLGYHRGDASLHGPMRNPWNRERWAGGSSAGSGAAVAAGLVPFAPGTRPGARSSARPRSAA